MFRQRQLKLLKGHKQLSAADKDVLLEQVRGYPGRHSVCGAKHFLMFWTAQNRVALHANRAEVMVTDLVLDEDDAEGDEAGHSHSSEEEGAGTVHWWQKPRDPGSSNNLSASSNDVEDVHEYEEDELFKTSPHPDIAAPGAPQPQSPPAVPPVRVPRMGSFTSKNPSSSEEATSTPESAKSPGIAIGRSRRKLPTSDSLPEASNLWPTMGIKSPSTPTVEIEDKEAHMTSIASAPTQQVTSVANSPMKELTYSKTQADVHGKQGHIGLLVAAAYAASTCVCFNTLQRPLGRCSAFKTSSW